MCCFSLWIIEWCVEIAILIISNYILLSKVMKCATAEAFEAIIYIFNKHCISNYYAAYFSIMIY